jgi:hypothetical protein
VFGEIMPYFIQKSEDWDSNRWWASIPDVFIGANVDSPVFGLGEVDSSGARLFRVALADARSAAHCRKFANEVYIARLRRFYHSFKTWYKFS